MQAFEIREFGIDKLARVERPEPEPLANQVLLRIRAMSLNYRDVMVVSGTYNPRMRLPAIPLSDAAGEIVAVGPDVSRWRIGDRVMPIFAQLWFEGPLNEAKRRSSLGSGPDHDGVLREFAAFDENAIFRVPDHLSFEQSATLPCAALTAWNALAVSGRVQPGETVLTLGSGGVSVFALQFAKLMGARVIATSGSDAKLQRLKELGADDVINYRLQPEWHKEVLRLTDGVGVDHVVEIGGAGTLPKSVAATRIGGHIALIGALSGGTGFDPISIFMKAIRMQGIFVGSQKLFAEMLAAVTVNELVPVIDRRFTFEDAPKALEYMKTASHFGKIVITAPE